MGVVTDLQSEALSENTDIMSSLRKAYLVSRKLRLTEFTEWVNRELNGYDVQDDVPKYRIYHGEVEALNPYNGWIPVSINEKIYAYLSTYDARYPIANLMDLYKKSKGHIYVYYNEDVNILLSEYSPFRTKFRLRVSANFLFSTFESVRNSILEWSIKLEESGICGDGLKFTDSEVKKASENLEIRQFVMNFYGDLSGTQIQQGTVDSKQLQPPLSTE